MNTNPIYSARIDKLWIARWLVWFGYWCRLMAAFAHTWCYQLPTVRGGSQAEKGSVPRLCFCRAVVDNTVVSTTKPFVNGLEGKYYTPKIMKQL